MQLNTIDNKIRLKHLQVQIENDPTKKQELNKQLRKLQFQKEIEMIKIKIEQLSS